MINNFYVLYRTLKWKLWCWMRPPAVRAVGLRLRPWSTYRLKKTGQLAKVVSISEDGTLRAFVWYEHLTQAFGHGVFGIEFDDLEEVI